MANEASFDAGGQLSLPADIIAAIQAIHDDKLHGASWLARAAARTMLQLIEPRDDVSEAAWSSVVRVAAQALVTSRPSMAAVANAAVSIWSAGSREAMLAKAERIMSQESDLQQLLVTHAEKLVAGDVYTMSRSATVEHVLRELGRRLVIGRVLVAESRPGLEGVALGRALAEDGLAVTLVADAASGVLIGEAICVLLGADSLRADGSVVNKVGSYPLALVARDAGKPVFVLCETLKIAAPAFPLTLEEGDATELLADTSTGMSVRNPYFDVTPASLITAYITEEGVLDRDAIMRYAEVAGAALALLQTR